MCQIICFYNTPSSSHLFLSQLFSSKLHAAKGLQPLVDLLCSYDKEVLHHACLVINVCATDEPSAIEMHRLG